ncbi:hypothetical protein [Aliagarivorans marinus]|uniref:hypothetical protein n=1 Tax=Aliagarivorans marinus TaxID=561965 RepID=UPI0003FB579D|nr:hypothetical protein [Aliagarivorans marinus]
MHKAFGLLLFLLTFSVQAKQVTLVLPSYSDESHLYYHELLEQALLAAGHDVAITTPSLHLPQKRAEAMLYNNQLSLVWLLHSEERDNSEQLVSVPVDLTNGLIGHRVLLIPPADNDSYRFVQTLDDFRQLDKTGGFGKNWFDVAVWQANDLNALEVDGEWRRLYKMVANRKRGIDYFSRGFTEVINESLQHPYLSIEPYLVLVYQRDFHFYLPAEQIELAQLLTEALEQARDSGLMDKLIEEYWFDDFKLLNFKRRVRIELATPK